MKDNKSINEESLRDLDDILDEVSEWFWNNCGENGYDNERQRYEDFEAMADKSNDMMVDQCIDHIDLSDAESDKYYDDIVDKLAKLCLRELDYM